MVLHFSNVFREQALMNSIFCSIGFESQSCTNQILVLINHWESIKVVYSTGVFKDQFHKLKTIIAQAEQS